MTLTIYGSPRSRTMRTLWAAAELGLAYDHIPLTWDDEALKSPEFLRLNPAGAIPTIVDDGFALGESLAINLYLARKYGTTGNAPLCPPTLTGEAETWRWSLWAQAHLEPWVQRDAKLDAVRAIMGGAPEVMVRPALALLDGALAGRAWLVGDHFTVADLNVAGVLSPSRVRHLDLRSHGHVAAWLAACYDRPAARATRFKFAQ